MPLAQEALEVAEPVISRDGAVAVLFNVSHVVATLRRIEKLLRGEDDGEETDEP